VWGDARPDLVAASGGDVLGSDDALAFATLPGLPDTSSQPWSVLTWTGVPAGSLLIAGPQRAGFFDTESHSWVSGQSGLQAARLAVGPSGQSVTYLLGADGALVRTLSAGRDPATRQLGRTGIVVGQTTRLSCVVDVAAPGTLLLRSRLPGRAWQTLRSVDWSGADWGRSLAFTLGPSLTHEYVLSFRYGTSVVALTQPVRLVVEPKVTTTRSRYDLRRGDIFRFSGAVAPELPGERVELYTDRGGSWRPVSLQPTASLKDGRTWTSRQFGTPVRETYHLRARLAATARHAAAWSRIVTVSIR
jgi:hypothetical protein